MSSLESLMNFLERLTEESAIHTDESLVFPIVKSPSKSEASTKALVSERISRRPELKSKDDLIIVREDAAVQKQMEHRKIVSIFRQKEPTRRKKILYLLI